MVVVMVVSQPRLPRSGWSASARTSPSRSAPKRRSWSSTATSNGASLDKSEPLPPKFSDHVDRVQRSVDYMTQLVNDLLALAHVGGAAIERTDVDLSTMAAEVMADLRRLAPEREATIDIAPALACRADPGLMRSALENLLGNAWKYSSRVAHSHIVVGSALLDGRPAFFLHAS